MKTPDEIKKLLANHKNYIFSAEELFAEALAYIRELEAELEAAKEREEGLSIMLTSAQSAAETYKRERDALSAELNEARAMVQDAKEHAELFMEELKQVKRERDAAIADMEEMQGCTCQMCKHYYQPDPNVRKWSCRVLGEYWADICEHDGGLLICGSFEWRGVQEDA